VRFTCVQADIDLKEVTINTSTGDYNPTSLASVINTETLNSLVVQTWLDKSGARDSPLVRQPALILVMQRTANLPLYFVSTFPTSGNSRKRFAMLELMQDMCTPRPLRPNGSC